MFWPRALTADYAETAETPLQPASAEVDSNKNNKNNHDNSTELRSLVDGIESKICSELYKLQMISTALGMHTAIHGNFKKCVRFSDRCILFFFFFFYIPLPHEVLWVSQHFNIATAPSARHGQLPEAIFVSTHLPFAIWACRAPRVRVHGIAFSAT
jgi:hypothetical protein